MNIPFDIATLAFEEATLIIDDSDVTAMVKQWLDDDVTGVFLTDVDVRTALTGWLALAFTGAPLDPGGVVALLTRVDTSFDIREDDLRQVTRQIISAMDSQDSGSDARVLTRRRRRQREFTNAILRAQLRGTGCVEDTISVALGSLVRSDSATYQVATLVSGDHLRSESVPNVVVSVAPDQLGGAVGELIRDLIDDEYTIGHVSGDLTYFPGLPAELAVTPLREHGAAVVMEYSPTDEGRALATAEGAVLVEGHWYRDDLPQHLLTAMKDFREASHQNRTPDGKRVLSPALQFDLEDRRNALLRARRAFQVPNPTAAHPQEQTIAYGSREWTMAYTGGRYANTRFEEDFRRIELMLAPQDASPQWAVADSFLTTLLIAATNVQRIAEWERYHSLDQGNGVLIDEWSAIYHMLVPRIEDIMSAWSRDSQPAAVLESEVEFGFGGHWVVIHSEDTDDWAPDGNAAVVEMKRATIETTDRIISVLAENLRAQAATFAKDGRDLSADARIMFRLDFIDAERYGCEEDDVWTPVPTEGVLIAADATLVPRHEGSRVY